METNESVNKAKNKICILGGDMRQTAIEEKLIRSRADVSSWGFDGAVNPTASWRDAINDASAVVLPLPTTTDGEHLNAPFADNKPKVYDIIDATRKNSIVLAGKASGIIKKYAAEMGVRLIDYFDLEEVQIKNTVPTAEGAIEIAMRELTRTIRGSKTTVLGYGRVGKTLAKTLLALKSDVTCAARSDHDLAWASIDGCISVPLAKFTASPPDSDVIFNTIPSAVISKYTLEKLRKDTLIIDLASAPGGVDFDSAKDLGIKAMLASSLPGKTSPHTAGEIIADALINILEKEAIL